jgi:hypothetical protein
MAEERSAALGDEFDHAVRRFNMQQDAVQAGPANERILSSFINIAQDWTVTTYRVRVERNRGGNVVVSAEDWILVTKGEGSTYTRLVIPPPVARIIARQYDALSTKNRSFIKIRKSKGKIK